MTLERLTASDKRLILVMIVIVAACAAYTRSNFLAAFPEASLDLRYSKNEITTRAERFLRERGLSTAGFRNLTLFDPDDEARTYLERELGLAEANRLMQSDVSVWRWRARWFRPPEQEEMRVLLSPAGKLAGFEHVIPEAALGARLDMESARRLASEFLAARTNAPQRLVEEQLQERPARYDYLFTWEQEGFLAKDATYRRTVLIQGDRVGRYAEYLHVPEQWKRDFAALRSKNELFAQAAQALYLALALIAVGLVIQGFRKRLLYWRPLLAIAGVVGVLMMANQWNLLPFFIDQMPTSSPFSKSLVFGVLEGLGAGIGVFFYVILAAAAGEPLYRRSQPARLSLGGAITRKGVRTREFFLATVTGYGFAAAHIAFIVAFYLIGRKFGVWSPQDINYSDFLSTGLPWIYPLTISLLASTSEEFWFRLLAIPLLKRWLRSTWLAVIIPAFVWGFLHATYPQQPGYIRGLEVGVIGVAAGFLMLRFGILATLIWHYTVDAVLIGMFLLRAESWYFRLSGWLVGGAVLLPLLVSVAFYLRRGGFLAEPELLNAAVSPMEEPAPAPVAETRLEPLEPRGSVKWLYVTAALAGVLGLLVSSSRYGDFIRVRLARPDAGAIADREFRKLVPNLEAWRSVTQFVPGLSTEEFEYVRRAAGSKIANDIVRERSAAGLWFTRYFRPLRKEEWRLFIDQQGRVFRRDHLLDEKAPGANLSLDPARRIAETHLRKAHGLAMERYRLVDSSTDKKDRRTDYSFTWEDSALRVGEARARVSLNVVGDEASGFWPYLKLPEQWQREFREPRLIALLIPGVVGATGLLLLLLFARRLSQRDAECGAAQRYHWREYLGLGVAGFGVAVVSSLNQWPLLLAGYDTAKPLENYWVDLLLGRLMWLVLAGFGLFFAALAADVFLQTASGDRRFRPPSVLRALAVFVAVWGAGRVVAGTDRWIPGPRLSLPLWDLPGADALFPAVSILARGMMGSITLLCLLAIAVAVAWRYLSPQRRYGLMALVAVVFAASRAQSLPQFAHSFLAAALMCGLLIVVLRTCAADLITFGVALFWLQTLGPAMTLIEQPAAALRWNGVFAILAATAIGLWVTRQRRV